MLKVIASDFRNKYRRIKESGAQHPAVGVGLHMIDGGRHLFYLVMTRWSHEKPI